MATTIYHEAQDVAQERLVVSLTVDKPVADKPAIFTLTDDLGRILAFSDSAGPLAGWVATYALALDKRVARGEWRDVTPPT
jgi:hypothetical protein